MVFVEAKERLSDNRQRIKEEEREEDLEDSHNESGSQEVQITPQKSVKIACEKPTRAGCDSGDDSWRWPTLHIALRRGRNAGRHNFTIDFFVWRSRVLTVE